MLTLHRLKELLSYDVETGIFQWRQVTSNRISVGSAAGTVNSKGYLIISIDGQRYRAHRLAYLYMTGDMPEDQIDHMNNVKTDNRWCNLREASNSQNHMNRWLQVNNTSGEKGVVFHKPSGRWTARVKVNGKLHSLGYYDDKDDAIQIVRQERKRLHGDFNREE